MKQFVLTLLLLTGWCCSQAQTITAAEYFVNIDPGAGNGVPITVTPSGTVNFTAAIPTTSLPNGFHIVGIRTKSNSGQWGLYESRGFYISTATISAADIIAAEYFIDGDPGIGNGIATTPIPNSATVNFVVTVPSTSLTQGFHFLGIRVKNADGQWSLYESRGFYISSATTDMGNIVSVEYFIDTDPGVGNGIAITPITSGNAVSFTTTIPTTSLSAGFHFLGIRTKDNNGHWGLYESRGFYISTATTNVTDITAAEYFVDSDPGVGNATAITPVSNGSTVNLVASIPTNTLAAGFHFVAIRTKDADGHWGLYESRGFYISTASNNMPDMTAAEYFIDTDPGVGNATAITITPGQTFTAALPLLVPVSTSQGTHFIAMRFKDADGKWGLFDFDTITVSGTIPVTGLTLQAQKWQDKVALNWFTLTESNSSHFELERSSDGVRFEKIAQVTAAGNSNSRRDYSYTDALPLQPVNYYRVRQVDRDGKAAYSAVQLVRMKTDKLFMVFPTVTTNTITISGINKPVWLRLYNTNKQLVQYTQANSSSFNLNMQQLPAGSYWLLIEQEGKVLQHEILIKQ